MTLIMGFDPSKSTGWSVFNTQRDHSAIQCGVLQMPEKADHYFTGEQIGQKVTALIRQFGRPDFAVLEEQSKAKIGDSSADGMLYPWIASTAIVATLGNFGVAYGTLPSGKWRKSFFGEGFKPPQKLVTERGKKKLKNDWKSPAIAECERFGIVLPTTKALADDAAEAAAIAICWRHKEMNFHARRHHQPWIDLIQRNERAAA